MERRWTPSSLIKLAYLNVAGYESVISLRPLGLLLPFYIACNILDFVDIWFPTHWKHFFSCFKITLSKNVNLLLCKCLTGWHRNVESIWNWCNQNHVIICFPAFFLFAMLYVILFFHLRILTYFGNFVKLSCQWHCNKYAVCSSIIFAISIVLSFVN